MATTETSETSAATITARSGRQAQAAQNDQRILDAARAVFTANPDAPIAAVAERAGVGMSALYRRYRSKDDLIQRLCLDGLQRYIAVLRATLADLADSSDPWEAFTRFMRRSVEAGTSSLTLRFAGTFTNTEELRRAGQQAQALTQQLLERVKAAHVLRADIEVADLSLIFEQLQAINVGDDKRAGQLRQRYLALMLDALRNASAPPLPGPPPKWEEITRRYDG